MRAHDAIVRETLNRLSTRTQHTVAALSHVPAGLLERGRYELKGIREPLTIHALGATVSSS